MCIFAGPVKSVSGTHLFVGHDNDRELVVYQMAVALRGKGNAMILPVPARADTIELHDLQRVPTFFKGLDALFTPQSRGMTKGRVSMSARLEVKRVGNYDVSIVPDVDAIDQLNPDVFEVSPRTQALLRRAYLNYSFVVAQLRESGEFHPLAYTHPVLDELFVPTRHEHGEGAATWDHHIYWQKGKIRPTDGGPTLGRVQSATTSTAVDTLLELRGKLLGGGADALMGYIQIAPLQCLRVQGDAPNLDLTITLP